MSSVITVGAGSETIHGTYDGAVAYAAIMYGETYDAWTALSADNRKKTLAAAVRYINAQSWLDDYDTFAERDAVAAFATAQYELAVMIASDPSVILAADQGSNIRSVGAGSTSVEYFNSTTKNAAPLPPVLMRLIGEYLGETSTAGPVAGSGVAGSDENPFSSCSDHDRGDPY